MLADVSMCMGNSRFNSVLNIGVIRLVVETQSG